jgi:surface antigen
MLILASLLPLFTLSLGGCGASGLSAGAQYAIIGTKAVAGPLEATKKVADHQATTSDSAKMHLLNVAWDGFGLSIPPADGEAADHAMHEAFALHTEGKSFSWSNETTSDHGTIKIVRVHSRDFGHCWNFEQEIVLGGTPSAGSSRVCQGEQGDGKWRVDHTAIVKTTPTLGKL